METATDAGPRHEPPANSEVTDENDAAAESGSVAGPSHAEAAASSGPDPRASEHQQRVHLRRQHKKAYRPVFPKWLVAGDFAVGSDSAAERTTIRDGPIPFSFNSFRNRPPSRQPTGAALPGWLLAHRRASRRAANRPSGRHVTQPEISRLVGKPATWVPVLEPPEQPRPGSIHDAGRAAAAWAS